LVDTVVDYFDYITSQAYIEERSDEKTWLLHYWMLVMSSMVCDNRTSASGIL